MVYPWLMVIGVSLFGYLLPEILVAAFKARVPVMMNIVSMVASGLIAAAVVIQ